MYFSPKDIQHSNASTLELVHQLARSYLDRWEECARLGASFQRDVLKKSRASLDENAGAAPRATLDAGNALGQALLKEQIPRLLSDVTHTVVQSVGKSIRLTENHLETSGTLVNTWWQRARSTSPWETLWMLHLAQNTVTESLTTLEHIGESAVEAVEKIDATWRVN